MGELERIGETAPFGWLLLELLALDGWHVHVRAALAGGSLLIARHPDLADVEIAETGENVAAAAPAFFARCVEARRPRRLTLVDDPA